MTLLALNPIISPKIWILKLAISSMGFRPNNFIIFTS